MRATLADASEGITLRWRPSDGATGYRVHRASADEDRYRFSVIAELPAGQTAFTDRAPGRSSMVYRVVAVGGRPLAYPLAARIVVQHAGPFVPIAVELEPSDVATALASLGGFTSVRDAATLEELTPSSKVHPGMVLKVDGARHAAAVMAGVMPERARVSLEPRRVVPLAVPLREIPLTLDELRMAGVLGAQIAFADGNAQPASSSAPLAPGTMLGLTVDRPARIDLARGEVESMGDPVPRLAAQRRLLGGSPDDGTQVVVLYDASYETRRYKCWSGGKSGAWDGLTDNADGADDVKNAGVVRRGRVMYVTDEAGMSASSAVTVWAPARPGQARSAVAWRVHFDAARNAAAITIPNDAPIGDYQVQIGSDRENYATVYVVFDPAPLRDKYGMSDEAWRAWAYEDRDWQTISDETDYLNYVFEGTGYPFGDPTYGSIVYGYRGASSESGADGGVFGQRWVELALSIHGDDTDTPLEAVLHAYQIAGQRISWTAMMPWYGKGSDGDLSLKYNTFDDFLTGEILGADGEMHWASELDVVTAERAALGLGWDDRLPASYLFDLGQCFVYATHLAALYRPIGIPGRAHRTIGGGSWVESFHAWAEACLDEPEIHPQQEGWWRGCWYKTDANDPSTQGRTSHEEGNIIPVVLAGFGNYLINEVEQCEGVGYGGSFFDNYLACDQSQNNPGTQLAVALKTGTSAAAEEADSSPLNVEYGSSESPWTLVNLFVPWDGPQRPSGRSTVIDSHHGYALNDTMYLDEGAGFIDDDTNENDVPELVEGVRQRGLVAGWGYMIYRVPVRGRSEITVTLTEGADRVEILATKDRNIHSTAKRWDLSYDFRSDASGTLTAATAGAEQLYLWFQLKGLSDAAAGYRSQACCGSTATYDKGQQVAWFTALTGMPIDEVPSGGSGGAAGGAGGAGTAGSAGMAGAGAGTAGGSVPVEGPIAGQTGAVGGFGPAGAAGSAFEPENARRAQGQDGGCAVAQLQPKPPNFWLFLLAYVPARVATRKLRALLKSRSR